jgi:mannose-6-phosphate isomerase-like protein (cupin superfamily)
MATVALVGTLDTKVHEHAHELIYVISGRGQAWN